jgi:serine/threonine protein phosphatase PrpC
VIFSKVISFCNLYDFSRCILSRGGRVACLTEDHRLTSCERELTRVRNTEGTFIIDGYLCGLLAVSKAFGNLEKTSSEKLLGKPFSFI